MTPWLCRDPGRGWDHHSWGFRDNQWVELGPGVRDTATLTQGPLNSRGCLCPISPHGGKLRPQGRDLPIQGPQGGSNGGDSPGPVSQR